MLEVIKLNESLGNWRLTVVQSECKTKLTYHVVECIFERQEGTLSLKCPNLVTCRLPFIYWEDFAEATYLLHKLRQAWGSEKNDK